MISLSSIDQERFGISTARDPEISAASIGAALEFCREHHVRLLIARCKTEDLTVAHRLEAAGGHLMDTLVYYTRILVKGELPENTCRVPVRKARPEDTEGVREVARDCFRGYYGHYHADPRLDRDLCDETYRSWAYRSCLSREVAGEVLVADDGAVAGFVTLRMNDVHEGEVVLGGVAPRAQGAGIYRGFIIEGMRWAKAEGARRIVVSTQITNLAVQKAWSRLGFEPARSYYTFHLWFDPA